MVKAVASLAAEVQERMQIAHYTRIHQWMKKRNHTDTDYQMSARVDQVTLTAWEMLLISRKFGRIRELDLVHLEISLEMYKLSRSQRKTRCHLD